MTTEGIVGATGDPTTLPTISRSLAAALAATEVAARLGSDVHLGIAPAEAEARLLEHGPNLLVHGTRPTAWATLLGQFRSTMIAVLAVDAVITLLIGDLAEPS